MTTEKGEISETNHYFLSLMLNAENRKLSKNAKATEYLTIEAETYFRKKHYFKHPIFMKAEQRSIKAPLQHIIEVRENLAEETFQVILGQQ